MQYMRSCATRFRENSNINAFAKEKRENNGEIQYKKIKYYYLKTVSIMSFHLSSFIKIYRIYKMLITIIILKCKHSFLLNIIIVIKLLL